jgi:hypothetical protein
MSTDSIKAYAYELESSVLSFRPAGQLSNQTSASRVRMVISGCQQMSLVLPVMKDPPRPYALRGAAQITRTKQRHCLEGILRTRRP